MVVHVEYKSWYISLQSFAEQHYKMTMCYVFKKGMPMKVANISYFHLEFNTVIVTLKI